MIVKISIANDFFIRWRIAVYKEAKITK